MAVDDGIVTNDNGSRVLFCLFGFRCNCWALIYSLMLEPAHGWWIVAIKRARNVERWPQRLESRNKRWAKSPETKTNGPVMSWQFKRRSNYLVHQSIRRITLITHRAHTANPFLSKLDVLLIEYRWLDRLWYFHEARGATTRRELRQVLSFGRNALQSDLPRKFAQLMACELVFRGQTVIMQFAVSKPDEHRSNWL